MKQRTFSIQHTNIVKGMAVMMLLWHHLFYNNPDNYSRYVSLFALNGTPIEAMIADLCKVCVAIFMFLSGYGLFKSYRPLLTDHTIKKDVVFIKNRVLKLMNPYWFIYIIFVPLSLFFGTPFYEVYGANPLHYIADFCGLSYLFYGTGSFTMNATWWYMSVILVYCIAFPMLMKVYKKFPEGVLLFFIGCNILLPGWKIRDISVWICPFMIGSYFADKQVFENLSRVLDSTVKQLLFIGGSFVLLALIRMTTNRDAVKVDFLFMLPFLLAGYFLIPKIPVLRKGLEELGKKSGLIFLFHTFIFSKYFQAFTYSFKYSILIYFVFLAICVAVAFALEGLMKLTRYRKLFDKLTAVSVSKRKEDLTKEATI